MLWLCLYSHLVFTYFSHVDTLSQKRKSQLDMAHSNFSNHLLEFSDYLS
jgi:hypothetical protein